MKFVILKFLLLLIYNFSLIQLAKYIPAIEKKNFRKIIKPENENNTSLKENSIDPSIIFEIQKEGLDNSERFNFDNIILNLSTIENKIKSFKNKLESN